VNFWEYDGYDRNHRALVRGGPVRKEIKVVQSRTRILSCISANHGKYIREHFRKK
jgi:hypothetical protein